MKYGNLSIPGMDIEKEFEVLESALEKGLLTEEQVKLEKRSMMKDYMKFLITTNGGGGIWKRKFTKKQAMNKQAIAEKKAREIADRINSEVT